MLVSSNHLVTSGQQWSHLVLCWISLLWAKVHDCEHITVFLNVKKYMGKNKIQPVGKFEFWFGFFEYRNGYPHGKWLANKEHYCDEIMNASQETLGSCHEIQNKWHRLFLFLSW